MKYVVLGSFEGFVRSWFNNTELEKLAKLCGFDMGPFPSRRHNKNVIESKHQIIRDKFICLKDENMQHNDTTKFLLVHQARRISNDLYGNNLMPVQELSKRYSLLIFGGSFQISIPLQIQEAQRQPQAERKLNLSLKSKSTTKITIYVGDDVDVFVQNFKCKRGRWFIFRPVLSNDHENRTVTVTGMNGRRITAELEDIRVAIDNNQLYNAIQESMDVLYRNPCYEFFEIKSPVQKERII